MHKLIQQHFHFDFSSSHKGHLDYLERNALRYAAGFVIRSLQKKIDKSAHRLKEGYRRRCRYRLLSLLHMYLPNFAQEVQVSIMTQRIGLML